MAAVDVSLAATLGDRFRLARTVVGMRQEDVAIQAGVSRTMVCRMELGRGGSISMGSWAAVASVLGVELAADFREPERSARGHVTLRCHALVARAAWDGGWRATTEIVRASRDRAPATVETILVRPFRNEAAVVHAWHPVPNVRALRHSRLPMPSDGLLWTDRWAERFRPAGRHPGCERPA